LKKQFFEHYRPTDSDFRRLWTKCIFAFDANVLLDLYRYSKESRDELMKLMRSHREKIWIPHQAALEFYKNRLSVISGVHTRTRDLLKALKAQVTLLENEYQQHPYIATAVCQKIISELNASIAVIESDQATYPDLLLDDTIGDELADILEGRIGESFASDELKELREKIEKRYDSQIPPGFSDRKDKDAPSSHGDCIIWFQLIAYAKSKKAPIIYITRDMKEDWWLRFNGKTLQPRPELRREFKEETGEDFYLYQTTQFIQQANVNQKSAISQRLLTESEVLSSAMTRGNWEHDIVQRDIAQRNEVAHDRNFVRRERERERNRSSTEARMRLMEISQVLHRQLEMLDTRLAEMSIRNRGEESEDQVRRYRNLVEEREGTANMILESEQRLAAFDRTLDREHFHLRNYLQDGFRNSNQDEVDDSTKF
jgi:hypothetical protein